MNIEIANRLIELRKKSGYSQEELADKLGLSRQAVSKWERAEASPDTDNLICLAKLYGVSLDQLLNTDETVEEIAKETKEKEAEKNVESSGDDSEQSEEKNCSDDKGDHIYIKNGRIHVKSEDGDTVDIDGGIHVRDSDGSSIHISNNGVYFNDEEKEKRHDKWNKISSLVFGCLFLLATVAYILLGFFFEGSYLYGSNVGWSTGWLVFFIPIIIGTLVEAIYKRKMSHFAMPVLVSGLYLYFSLFYGIWHPLWVIFLSIPIYYIIAGFVDHKEKTTFSSDVKISDVKDADDDEEEDDIGEDKDE